MPVTAGEPEMGELLYAWELQLQRKGLFYVAGLDEVGRGPLAGPVAAAAVILPPGVCIKGIQDSKRMSASERKRMATVIKEICVTWAVGWASVKEIDCLNILVASRWAMWRALDALPLKPQHVLVDGFGLPGLPVEQTPLIGGDSLSASIAAASILAKVARDELMQSYDKVFPGYGLGCNMGYPTRKHREAIKRLGPTPLHRMSFKLFAS